MKYFYLTGLLFFVLGSVVFFVYRGRKIKYDFMLRRHLQKIFHKQALLLSPTYFATPVVRKDLKSGAKHKTTVWNKWQKAAFFAPQKVLHKLAASDLKNSAYYVFKADLLWLLGYEEEARDALAAAEHPKDLYTQARKLFLQAAIALREGDLQTASADGMRAIKLFAKQNNGFEEAETYLLLGTIYRISAVYDLAQMMLTNAADIFGKIGANHKLCEVYGNLGMLTAVQERYDEAEDYFTKAEKLISKSDDPIRHAEINNQRVLSLLATGKLTEALALLKQNQIRGQGKRVELCAGFTKELESRIRLAQKHWHKAAIAAKLAVKHYQTAQNLPAEFEAQMLCAQAAFAQNDWNTTEQITRAIITKAEKQSSCFHIANAYSLLGLVFMKKGDFKRAKGLIKQSLNQEIRNERCSGMAIDYANLALIEKFCGNREQAQQTLQQALEYAQMLDESDLSAQIKKLLN